LKNYIFGYGSLIERNSRLRTIPSAEIAYPAKVSFLKRGWFARTPTHTLSTTYLGCVPYDNEESMVNGVIFEVSEQELKDADDREKGYDRIPVDPKHIEFYMDTDPIDLTTTKIWVYINKFPEYEIPDNALPDAECPIVESYVDICIHGCIEVESEYERAKAANYIKDFIESTDFWLVPYWVNDRIYPRRPFMYCPQANQIDKALINYLKDPDLIKKIKIE